MKYFFRLCLLLFVGFNAKGAMVDHDHPRILRVIAENFDCFGHSVEKSSGVYLGEGKIAFNKRILNLDSLAEIYLEDEEGRSITSIDVRDLKIDFNEKSMVAILTLDEEYLKEMKAVKIASFDKDQDYFVFVGDQVQRVYLLNGFFKQKIQTYWIKDSPKKMPFLKSENLGSPLFSFDKETGEASVVALFDGYQIHRMNRGKVETGINFFVPVQ